MLNKQHMIALCCALLASSAQAELTQLDDSSLSNITGQSGVQIDLSIKGDGINIQEISYTDILTLAKKYSYDTNGDGVNDTSAGGTLLLQNITIKDINNMRQIIEIEDGAVSIKAGAVDGVSLSMGDAPAVDSNNYSAVVLSSEDRSRESELVDSLALKLNLGKSDIQLYSSPSQSLLYQLNVSDFYDTSDPQMLINIKSSLEVTNMNAEILGFTQAAAERKVRAENNLASNASLTKSQRDRVNRLADEGALTIKGLKFYGKNKNSGEFKAGNKVSLSQTVWIDNSQIFMKSAALSGQLEIDTVGAGQNPLGSLKVENIQVSPMINKIYAH